MWSIREGRHRVAAFYRNGAIHHFVDRAIVELALLAASRAPAGSDPVEAALAEALRAARPAQVRVLLPLEAPLLRRHRGRDDAGRPRRGGSACTDPDAAAALLEQTRFLVAPRTLRSFVDAQWVVATKLAALGSTPVTDAKALAKECLGLGRQMLRQGRVARPDSVSLELYTAALDLADNRGLLDPGTGPGRRAGPVFRDEIAEVRDRLVELARIEDRLTEELLA